MGPGGVWVVFEGRKRSHGKEDPKRGRLRDRELPTGSGPEERFLKGK